MTKRIVYDYAEYGHFVQYVPQSTLYLDVGNTFLPGVVDHHHLSSHDTCTSAIRMIWELLTSQDGALWSTADETLALINRLRDDQEACIRIILHRDPDLDAFMSAFVLSYYLDCKSLPKLPAQWIELADKADRGAFHDDIFKKPNIYAVLEIIHDEIEYESKVSKYEESRKTFFSILQSLIDSNLNEEKFIEQDPYFKQCQKVMLQVPNPNREALLNDIALPVFEKREGGFSLNQARPAAWIHMEKGRHFNIVKSMYRKPGGPVWIVSYPKESNQGKDRIVLSVEKEDSYSLFGYGWRLEKLEQMERGRKNTVFVGKENDYPIRKGPSRPGFHGPDPWYDGRNHRYTIVDAPNSGTILGELDRNAFLQQLDSRNRQWNQDFVDALLDGLRRAVKMQPRQASQTEEAFEKKLKSWKREISDLLSLAECIFELVQDDPSLAFQIRECLLGLCLFDDYFKEQVTSAFPWFCQSLERLEQFKELWKMLGIFLSEHRGLSVLDQAVALDISLKKMKQGDQTLLVSTIGQYASPHRMELLEAVSSVAVKIGEGRKISSAAPPLYRLAEYAELFHQLLKWKQEGNCLVWDSLKKLHDLDEHKLTAILGINPLLYGFRLAKQRMDLPLRVKALQNWLKQESRGETSSLSDESHIDFIDMIENFYELALFLSGSKERHCRGCEKQCIKDLDKEEPVLLPPARNLLTSYQKIKDIPGTPDVLEHIEKVSRSILDFFAKQGKELPIIKSSADETILLLEKLQQRLKQIDAEQKDNPSWWVHPIQDAFENIFGFFCIIRSELKAFELLLNSGDAGAKEETARDLLTSLTFEQMFNQKPDLINLALERLFEGQREITIKGLTEVRSWFRSQKSRTGDQQGGNKVPRPELLRKLYETRHEELMDMPALLKKNLFSLIVKKFQDDLYVSSSAKLLDAFQGRNKRNIFGLDPLVSLPLACFIKPFRKTSIQSIFSAWLPVVAGFAAAVYLPFSSGFKWYTGLLAGWFILSLTHLVGQGRLFASGFEKIDFPNPDQSNPVSVMENHKDICIGRLISGQLLPHFVVPMLLALSPFVLSDELKTFIYEQVETGVRFISVIVVFGCFSIFALYKLQNIEGKRSISNVWKLFSTLWVQSFIFAYFMPLLIQANPILDKSKEYVEKDILGIPRMLVLCEVGSTPVYVFPVATILFSFLCLFAGIFLEGIVKKK